MRDVPAAFDGETKFRLRGLIPIRECLLTGKMIKTVVHLYRVELFAIPPQHVPGWKVRWIKWTPPVLVMPAGCADTNIAA
jgi:hypothetical protein